MKLCHIKLMSRKLISCYCILYNILNTCKTGMGEEVISVAIYSTAARLGYAMQFEAMPRKCCKGIHYIFVSLSTGYSKSFCYYCLLWVFDFLKGKQSLYHFVNIDIFYIIELHPI